MFFREQFIQQPEGILSQKISITISTPSGCESVKINKIFLDKNLLIVISKLAVENDDEYGAT